MSLALNAAPFLRDETNIENKNKTSSDDIKKRLRKNLIMLMSSIHQIP